MSQSVALPSLVRTPPRPPASDTAGPDQTPTSSDQPTPGLPPSLWVEPWIDPTIDPVGHDPRGGYVEKFWLPVLGPSTVLLLRRIADEFDAAPEGFELDLDDTARRLGIGIRSGKHAPVVRALDRCCTFGAAQRFAERRLLVRRRLAPLTRRHLARLPEPLRVEHDGYGEPGTEQAVAEMRRRARALALSMLELGETYDDTERQLHRWRFHPAVSHEAMVWATAEYARRNDGNRRPA